MRYEVSATYLSSFDTGNKAYDMQDYKAQTHESSTIQIHTLMSNDEQETQVVFFGKEKKKFLDHIALIA